VGKRILGGYAVLVYVFLFAPIGVVVFFAFNGGRRFLFWEGFSTKWFGEALSDETITDALQRSVVIALASTGIAIVLGTLLALALPRMRPIFRVPFDALVYMTLVTPEIVFGIAALIFFVQLVDVELGLRTVIVSHAVFNTSVVALIVRARFVGMGRDLEEASYDLGAGPIATFRQVTLPRLAPAILAGGLLAFTFSFDDFITSNFVTGPGSQTLPMVIFGSVRFGISPVINATAAMVLGLTLVAIVLAYVVLRRTGQLREEAVLPRVTPSSLPRSQT
jgi:spermidine/putrescine transport system permease protein